MSTNPFSRHLQNVTDPSDWKATKIPELKQLDALQRCYICKEFLKGPVITGCFHTFCSHCIREYLLVDHHCPLCKSEQFESNLKRDILLEEIVTIYSSLRSTLLENLQSSEIAETAPSSKSDSHESSRLPHRSSSSVIEVSSDDSIENKANHPPLKKIKMSDDADLPVIPKRHDMVECPICSEIMDAHTLQAKHIDRCLTGDKSGTSMSTHNSSKRKAASKNGITSFFKQSSTRQDSIPMETNKAASRTRVDHSKYYFDMAESHSKETKRLPKLDFSSLNTPKLKEKMTNLKLPTQGTRLQLELRYNQYYVLYNSNLDSNRPIPDKLLRNKLNQWESSHSAFNNSSSPGLFDIAGYSHNKSITDKDFSPKLWLKTFSKEYRRLIKAAIPSAKSAQKEVPNQGGYRRLIKAAIPSAKSAQKEVPDQDGYRSSTPSNGAEVIDAAVPASGSAGGGSPKSDANSSTPIETVPQVGQYSHNPPEIDISSLDFKHTIEDSPLFISRGK